MIFFPGCSLKKNASFRTSWLVDAWLDVGDESSFDWLPVLNQDTLREGLRESIKRGIEGFVSALVPRSSGGDIVEL